MNRIYKVLEYQIYISESVLKIIESFIQDTHKKNESGGILLGQVKNKNIYIQKVTTPNKFDKSSRCGFIRDKNTAQIILDYEVINSDFTVTYLGEWHTHPEKIPLPSSQDLKMIKGQNDLGKLNLPFVILIIQGIEQLYVSMFSDNDTHIAKA